jgi:VWFA-related protein
MQAYSRPMVVEVTVTDENGQAVRNLSQTDFAIKEDDKPQPIRRFQEAGGDTPTPQRPAQKLPPNVYANLPEQPTTSAVNILLLDALNGAPADQAIVKQESQKYLRSMPKGSRIAIFGLSGSLHLLQGINSDPAVLAAAADSKKLAALPSPFDSYIDVEMESRVTNTTDDETAAVLAQFENEQVPSQQEARNRITLEGLNQIAAYVSEVRGRKNLIWFTSGIPVDLSAGGASDLGAMNDDQKSLRKTTDLLTTAEVAMYPVDAHMLAANSASGADQHATATEKAIAEATGGAVFEAHDLNEAVGKVIDNGANYYDLVYSPPGPGYDGKYHSISVEVDRPGVHLGYRKGFDADNIADNEMAAGVSLGTSTPGPYGDTLQASMVRGAPISSQLLFDVQVVPSAPRKPADPVLIGNLDPKLKGRPLVRYDVQYFLPSRQVTLSGDPNGVRNGSIKFKIAAYDVYGKFITDISVTRNLAPTPEQYQQMLKQPVQLLQQIDLPHGEVFLRVGVLDGVSDRAGTLEIPLLVSNSSVAQSGENGGK